MQRLSYSQLPFTLPKDNKKLIDFPPNTGRKWKDKKREREEEEEKKSLGLRSHNKEETAFPDDQSGGGG